MGVFRPVSRILLPLVLLLTAGCSSIGYYGQAAVGQLRVMGASRPVEEVLADPATTAMVRARLEALPVWRAFARDELKLDASDSYRRYADVGSEAMVWSLVAAPADSLQPREWCYPVVGCASYRGYFRKAAALQHARDLAGEGWDVAVVPVPAYSTLGWFSDPLPSTVVGWPPAEVAGLLFHELAHEQLYLPGDSAFNEGYATLVETEGVKRWLTHLGDEAAHRDWSLRQRRKQAFLALLQRARQRLDALYRSGLEGPVLQSRKQAVFEGLRGDYAVLKANWQGYSRYDRWFDRRLNNAHLAGVATYQSLLPAFRALLQRSNGDMAGFHRACQDLAQMPEPDRRAAMQALLLAAAAPQ